MHQLLGKGGLISSADRNLRIALIGYGFAGSVFHAPLITATPGLEIAAVVTRSPDRARRAGTEHPDAAIVGEVSVVFDHASDYDGVVVATPHASHAALAVAALEAGLPVVVDKPIAETTAQAGLIAAAAERSGVAATVFQNRRFDSEILTLKKYLAELTLGQIVRFESRYLFYEPDVSAKDAQPAADSAGGLVLDLGSHVVDQALQLFGPAATVYAEVATVRRGAHVPDDFFMSLSHRSGTVSHLSATKLGSTTAPRITVQGMEGSLQINDRDPQEDQLKAGMRPGAAHFGTMRSPKAIYVKRDRSTINLLAVPGDHAQFYRQWNKALRGEGRPPVDLSDGIATLEVLQAALTASRERVSILLQ